MPASPRCALCLRLPVGAAGSGHGLDGDFGECKPCSAIFKMLDHQRCTSRRPGRSVRCRVACAWILHKARVVLPQVDRGGSVRNPGCGARPWWARKARRCRFERAQ